MEIGTLFRLKGQTDIYRVVENDKNSCGNCCAVSKERLCKKMPYCYVKPPVCFEKLSSYEVRQVKNAKQFVEYFES